MSKQFFQSFPIHHNKKETNIFHFIDFVDLQEMSKPTLNLKQVSTETWEIIHPIDELSEIC